MRRVETLIIVLALAFYVWFLRRFGLSDVMTYVRLAGWGLVITVSLEAVARAANTLGWRVTIEHCPLELKFPELFVARIAGEAPIFSSVESGGEARPAPAKQSRGCRGSGRSRRTPDRLLRAPSMAIRG